MLNSYTFFEGIKFHIADAELHFCINNGPRTAIKTEWIKQHFSKIVHFVFFRQESFIQKVRSKSLKICRKSSHLQEELCKKSNQQFQI